MNVYKFILFLTTLTILSVGCKKEEIKKSEKFILLTSHIWTSETLEANGVDASGPGEFLEDFVGDAQFNEDGTGYLGGVSGTWRFSNSETQLVINSADLAIPVTTNIVELSETRLEVTTSVPNPANPLETIDVKLVYVAK